MGEGFRVRNGVSVGIRLEMFIVVKLALERVAYSMALRLFS